MPQRAHNIHGMLLRLATLAVAGTTLAHPGLAEERLVTGTVPDAAIRVDTGRAFQRLDTLTLRYNIYRTARVNGPTPVVVIYNGFARHGIRHMMQMREWGRFLGSNGLAAVTYDSQPRGESADLDALLAHLRADASALGIDTSAIGLLSWSGHAFRAYNIVMDPARQTLDAAVFMYGVGPSAHRARHDVPTLFVRAGLDEVALNQIIDSVAAAALAANGPVTVMNLPGSTHGFDGADDNEVSRNAMRSIAQWLRIELSQAQRTARIGLAGAARAATALYTQDWPTAVAAYQELLRRDSTSTTLHIRLGHALTGAGRYEQALAAYQRAIDRGDRRFRDIANGAVVAAAGLRSYEAAMPWLQLLLQRGYTGKQLWDDPRLEIFRADERFRRLTGQ